MPQSQAQERRMLGLILAGVLLLFWPTVLSFPVAWSRSYQEHGFVVAALVGWMIWRHRTAILGAPGDGETWILPTVVGLSLLWLVAVVSGLGVVHQILFIGILTSTALASFGREGRVPILGAALTFMLAIPIWGAASPLLQRATTIMSGSIARLAGATAVIRGDTITIASGTFLVEAGCSGINYLLGGLTLAAVYGQMFTTRWTTRLKILAVAGAAAIVANWLRVALLVIIGDATSITSPLIEDHLWQGWLIFTLLMVPTYAVIRRVERRDARLAPTLPGPEPEPGEEPGRPDPARPRRFALAGMAAVVGPLAYLTIGVIPTSSPDPRIQDLGLADHGVWTEEPVNAVTWRPAFTGVDEEAHWAASFPEGRVQLARYFFADQRQGEELIQWNNVIAPDSMLYSDRLVGPAGPERMYLREAVVRDAEGPRLVWYWYRVAGLATPFAIRAKALEVLSFVTRAAPSELVVLSSPCLPDSCAEAAEAMRRSFDPGGES